MKIRVSFEPTQLKNKRVSKSNERLYEPGKGDGHGNVERTERVAEMASLLLVGSHVDKVDSCPSEV